MLHIAEGFSGNIDPGVLVEHCSPSVTALITQQHTGAVVSIPVTFGAMISPRVLFIDNDVQYRILHSTTTTPLTMLLQGTPKGET